MEKLRRKITSPADRPYQHNANGGQTDFRNEFERDFDRLLYCSSFRRLAGVTQVVNPSEGQIFHNRLTHSLKVAQTGKRIGQKLLKDLEKEPNSDTRNALDYWGSGSINTNAIEAAALAHDLGNPPFGHIAESELNELLIKNGLSDGFEGNAQSFRIVNTLSMMYKEIEGLNLTATTLNAILKYPWPKQIDEKKLDVNTDKDKFGVYQEEIPVFNLIRSLHPELYRNNQRTIEASIMDISDDISYAIHDFEDFFKANLIVYEQISQMLPKVIKSIESDTNEAWYLKGIGRENISELVSSFFNDIVANFPLQSPYRGGLRQRTSIHVLSAGLLKKFINSVEINTDIGPHEHPIVLPPEDGIGIIFLKKIAKYYVIEDPKLIRQQFGEKQIIKYLFNTFCDAISEEKSKEKDTWRKILPASCYERLNSSWDELDKSLIKSRQKFEKNKTSEIDRKDVLDKTEMQIGKSKLQIKLRIIADTISNMTDQEAIATYSRLTGISTGSIFDNILS